MSEHRYAHLVPDEPEQRENPLRGRLLTVDQLAKLPPPQPLIDGLLDLDNVGLVYGRRGAYKSFLAADWGLCVASGLPWQGREVRQGPVLYVVAEGVSGVHQRIEAWQEHRGPADVSNFVILPEAVNLLSAQAVDDLAEVAQDHGAVFVVLDTLARCMIGGDENSTRDTGMAFDSLDIIRRTTGAHVHVVHHAGKDATRGARGNSAIEAAADSVLEVSASDTIVSVKTTKQKNRAEIEPISLRAQLTGRSIVLIANEGPQGDGPLTKKDIDAIAALASIAIPEGVAMGAWVEAAGEVGVGKTSVYRTRRKGLADGLIAFGTSSRDTSPKYVVTPDGGAKCGIEVA